MMQDHIEQLVIGVRADTVAFARDVAAMKGELEGPLANGALRTGRQIEFALGKAVSGGKLSFADLRKAAVGALAEIAQASLAGLSGGAAGRGASPSLGSLASMLSSLPGRATGGPVDSGRPYVVGERGPELFVPSSAGRIEPSSRSRNVQISLTLSTPPGVEAQALRQSSRQIARSLRKVLVDAR